jgi:hypothetical protein
MAKIIAELKEKHYKNEEIQEIANVVRPFTLSSPLSFRKVIQIFFKALRNLKLAQGMAMEPLIEQCILKESCTFSVTGSKSFLLQVPSARTLPPSLYMIPFRSRPTFP